MLKKMFKAMPVLVALTLFTTGAVAETEMKTGKCAKNARVLNSNIALSTNTDPQCGDYYKRCDASGTCYECIVCSYGGPYCWEISE
jgi:hypothetical protein